MVTIKQKKKTMWDERMLNKINAWLGFNWMILQSQMPFLIQNDIQGCVYLMCGSNVPTQGMQKPIIK